MQTFPEIAFLLLGLFRFMSPLRARTITKSNHLCHCLRLSSGRLVGIDEPNSHWCMDSIIDYLQITVRCLGELISENSKLHPMFYYPYSIFVRMRTLASVSIGRDTHFAKL